jgi:hypothetical protein
MKTYEEVDVQIHVFLTSALVGGEWSASLPVHFTLRGKSLRCPLDRSLGGPQNRLNYKHLTRPGLEIGPLSL